MYIAKLSLICLVAFAFMVGCGMIGKEAEMPETAATSSMEDAAMGSEVKGGMAESMDGAAAEEITLNVTGMT
jgi:hypothetical protein